MTNIEYENLVIEGGGVLGIAYLGALNELYNDGSMRKAKRFAGSSIGSIVATLLAVRADYKELENVILDLDLSKFRDRTWIFGDIIRFFKQYGFYKGDKLLAFVKEMLNNITGDPDITFKGIYDRYGSKLVITGTNISKGCVSYFNLENTPNMPVALANRISCSVPYFFQAVVYEGDFYVDGGVLNNYPIGVFDKSFDKTSAKTFDKTSYKTNKTNNKTNNKTLGLKLVSDADIDLEKGFMQPITNIKTYSQNLISSLQYQALKVYVNDADWKRTISIYTGNLSFLNFNLSNEEKLFLVNEGSKGVRKYKEHINERVDQ